MAVYSGNPGDSALSEVRYHLGDVDTEAETPVVSDEEITFWIARLAGLYDDPIMVAAVIADGLAARYTGEVSVSADGVSVGTNELQDKYAKLAVQLRALHARLGGLDGGPYLGALDRTALPPGHRPAMFGPGMHDNIEAGTQDSRGTWFDDELRAGR